MINTVQAEDILFENGYIKNIHINIEAGESQDFELNFKPENSAVSLKMHNLKGEITAEYEVCRMLAICLWGNLTVNLKKNGFGLDADLDLGQMTADNGKMVPKLSLENFNAALTSDDLDIEISGSLNGWGTGLVVDTAEWLLLPGVMKAINVNVPPMWNGAVEPMMKSFGGIINTGFYNMGIDLSYASAPEISTEHMQIFLNALFFNTTTGEKLPTDITPDMKVDLTTTDSLQVGIAEQTLNSVVTFIHEAHGIDFTLTNADIGFLNTTGLESMITGFEAKYGKNVPVDLHITSFQAPQVSIKAGEFSDVGSFGV